MKNKAGKEKEHGAEKTAEIRELTTWTIKKKTGTKYKEQTARKSSPKAAHRETREQQKRNQNKDWAE